MVFYYTRSGKTKIFADVLGNVLGQNVCELQSDLNKKGGLGFLFKALPLAFSGKSFPVTNMPEGVPDEIYLCAPVWGGNIAAPVKYFLENADIKNTVVNVLLTASMPVEKYKQNAMNILNKTSCRPGRVFIFATADKVMPEAEAISEQLREML
ncbi:MAG: hypothetical protein FWF80_04525 [Defluviitaleaceae bacterium]|nr:hypothetical protein [Defluviitaleaceae bacterium]